MLVTLAFETQHVEFKLNLRGFKSRAFLLQCQIYNLYFKTYAKTPDLQSRARARIHVYTRVRLHILRNVISNFTSRSQAFV